jgi:predicted DNA-binding protein (MmcQ/YjbR family)
MNVEAVREYCIVKPGVTEGFPFDETTLVFKVGGKMFCLMSLDQNPSRINLKCDPEEAISLRETYPSIIPGYHMNKKYWNTVILDGSIENTLIRKMIDDSYDLIYFSLPAKIRHDISGR